MTGRTLLLLLLTWVLAAPGQGQSVCVQSGYQEACFDSLRALLRNTSAWWYGTDYLALCPNGTNSFDPLCSNGGNTVVADSIASRMFGDQNYDLSSLNASLRVSFQSPPGTYWGCGNAFRTTQQNFTLDPLSPQPIPPWLLRMTPEVTWDAAPGLVYTVIVYDTAAIILHGLYINIQGASMTSGELVEVYGGPRNPTPRVNAYVYALFSHPEPLNSTAVRNFFTNYTRMGFPSALFFRQFNLRGPLAVNMMLARSDAYAVGSFQTIGLNYCAYLIKDGLDTYGLSFTRDYSPRANLNVSFQAQPLAFQSCCRNYNYPAQNVTLNPLATGFTESVYVRDRPTVSIGAVGSSFGYLFGRLFTLMLVDAQPELDNRSNTNLTVHWQVVNIPGTSVEGGQELLSYVGVGPGGLQGPHLYVYLLLEQTRGTLSSSIPPTYAGSCAGVLAGRCQYRVRAFMEENGLKLVGATFYRLTSDPYTRFMAVASGQAVEGVCRGVEGFGTPCPTTQGQSVCMQSGYQEACFDSLRALLRNTSAWWYGTDYLALCPNGTNSFDPLCSNNGNPAVADSIASRMFGDQNYDLSSLNASLRVSFQSPPGTYWGCGNEFSTTQQSFTLDPLGPQDLPPWLLRMTPEVTWDAAPGLVYTVIVYDTAPLILHGLYINIQGASMTSGEPVQVYSGPLNPAPRVNAYVYALFSHPEPLNSTAVRVFYTNYTRRGFPSALFFRQFNLRGPLAINMMLARSDGYSVGFFQTMGQNYCAYLIKDGLDTYGLSFTRDYSPRANLNVSFQAQSLAFQSCCTNYNYPTMSVTLNPLAMGITESVYVRDSPTVSIGAIASNAGYFVGRLFTLMLVDAQPELDNRSNTNLTVHWQVVNIPGTSVEGGQELLSYVGVGPGGLQGPHLYVYLLLEQTRGTLSSSIPPTFAGSCVGVLAGRCQYRVRAFMEENGLKLVGANFYRLTSDPYTRFVAVTSGQAVEGVCRGVEGFQTPCPTSTAPPICLSQGLLLLLLLFTILQTLV